MQTHAASNIPSRTRPHKATNDGKLCITRHFGGTGTFININVHYVERDQADLEASDIIIINTKRQYQLPSSTSKSNQGQTGNSPSSKQAQARKVHDQRKAKPRNFYYQRNSPTLQALSTSKSIINPEPPSHHPRAGLKVSIYISRLPTAFVNRAPKENGQAKQ